MYKLTHKRSCGTKSVGRNLQKVYKVLQFKINCFFRIKSTKKIDAESQFSHFLLDIYNCKMKLKANRVFFSKKKYKKKKKDIFIGSEPSRRDVDGERRFSTRHPEYTSSRSSGRSFTTTTTTTTMTTTTRRKRRKRNRNSKREAERGGGYCRVGVGKDRHYILGE